MKDRITEEYVVQRVIDFLKKKENGNWDEETLEKAKLHEHNVDIFMKGGKKHGEYFFIECKGKSYAKSAKSINKENWLNALGQIITRMTVKKYTVSRVDHRITDINRAYKYGLGLYWVGAKVALRRIPKEAARVLNLYIFSVDDNGNVKQFTPKDFGKDYPDDVFIVR